MHGYSTTERESDLTTLDQAIREQKRNIETLEKAHAAAVEYQEFVALQEKHGPQKAALMRAQSSFTLQQSLGNAIDTLQGSGSLNLRSSGGGADVGAYTSSYPLTPAMKELSTTDLDRITDGIATAKGQLALAMKEADELRESIAARKRHLAVMRRRIRDEVAALQSGIATTAGGIERGRTERNDLVRRYVLWRRRREFDEDAVAPTFEQELAIGPRVKDVETQCVIQSEFLPMQVLKLVRLMDEQDALKSHLRIIRSIVNDMNEINRFMQMEITCPQCGGIFQNCVVAWPCGHSYCAECFDQLAVAPGVFRCRVCMVTSADGCTANYTVNEVVGRWLFKRSGFSDVVHSADAVQSQLAVFSKAEVQRMLRALASVSEHL
jgi:hypothetical protein